MMHMHAYQVAECLHHVICMGVVFCSLIYDTPMSDA